MSISAAAAASKLILESRGPGYCKSLIFNTVKNSPDIIESTLGNPSNNRRLHHNKEVSILLQNHKTGLVSLRSAVFATPQVSSHAQRSLLSQEKKLVKVEQILDSDKPLSFKTEIKIKLKTKNEGSLSAKKLSCIAPELIREKSLITTDVSEVSEVSDVSDVSEFSDLSEGSKPHDGMFKFERVYVREVYIDENAMNSNSNEINAFAEQREGSHESTSLESSELENNEMESTNIISMDDDYAHQAGYSEYEEYVGRYGRITQTKSSDRYEIIKSKVKGNIIQTKDVVLDIISESKNKKKVYSVKDSKILEGSIREKMKDSFLLEDENNVDKCMFYFAIRYSRYTGVALITLEKEKHQPLKIKPLSSMSPSAKDKEEHTRLSKLAFGQPVTREGVMKSFTTLFATGLKEKEGKDSIGFESEEEAKKAQEAENPKDKTSKGISDQAGYSIISLEMLDAFATKYDVHLKDFFNSKVDIKNSDKKRNKT